MKELNQVKIIIVEDEELIAEDIKEICEANGYYVVATCYNGKNALETFESTSFDLALLDIKLEGYITGIQLASYLHGLPHAIPYIFITSYYDQKTLKEAKELTPQGYIVKPFTKEQLISTIEISLYNASSLSRPKNMSKKWIEDQFKIELTEREFEILLLIYNANTNEQIGKKIFLSINTVKFHIKNIYEKLNVSSRTQLINLLLK